MTSPLPRKLAAILYADVAGYSRLTGENEDATHRTLRNHLDLIADAISTQQGKVMHYAGDAVLARFEAVFNAVVCAIDIQEQLFEENKKLSEERRVSFRIGVNLGDVIEDRGDIYGEGVNVAARLEGIADVGGVCISEAVRTALGKRLPHTYEYLGAQQMKNIEEPVRAYRVLFASFEQPASLAPERLPSVPDKPSVAVLPFNNMSSNPEQDLLSDGISEDIITALSKISKLFVVARNSTFTYKGRAVDVKKVGREQGVRYVLEGGVRRGGNRLRITAQLTDTETGHHIWAQRYNRVMQDVFELQDEITREVTSALQVELTDGESARLWASGTRNLEAWEIIIQVPELIYSHRKPEMLQGRQMAKAALELDAHYATAWTFLGWSYHNEVFNAWSEDPEETLHLAMHAAKKSQSIDDLNPETLALLAMIQLSLRDYSEALALSERAMTLGPNNSFVAGVAAQIPLYCNQPEKQMALLEKAIRLCPVEPAWYSGDVAWAHLLMNQREDAVAAAERSIQIDPDYLYTYCVQAVAFNELDRRQEARNAVRNILRLEPGYSLHAFSQTQPFRDPEVLNRHLTALGESGLPE